LLKREGLGIKDASYAMSMFNLGSVIATLFAGWLIARAGAAVILPLVMIGSAVSMALVGYAAPSVDDAVALVFHMVVAFVVSRIGKWPLQVAFRHDHAVPYAAYIA
jgi:MFS family permease